MAAQFRTIDEYIASFPADVQSVLREVLRRCLDAVPGAEQTISYGIPTLKLDGHYVVYFAAWKHHISVYPIPRGDTELQADLDPYRAAKGTLKFMLNKPIPYDLITRVAAALVQEREARYFRR